MTYSIWIVNSFENEQGHTRCFEEVALCLQAAFKQLGHDVPIVRSHEQATGRVIVLGGGVLYRHKIVLPKDMIMYNFEQVHDEGRFFKPDHPYINYLRRYPVWDYSHQNVTALHARGVTDVTFCPVGYMPELTRIPQADEDIDVLFIGMPGDRRQKILDGLKARGLKVHIIHDMYGAQRDKYIARSKIIINIHVQPAQIFEIVRCSYMLANRKCIVSEAGRDNEIEGPLKDAIAFAPYDRLVDTCVEYVQDEKKRKAQAEAGFKIFSAMSQVPMLRAALEESERRHPLSAPPPPMPRICVEIASYRDPECKFTLKDMYEKAAHPERVFAAICLQVDPEADKQCMVDPNLRPGQIRIKQVHYKEAKGANWARAESHTLWQGEEFVLQIDSHMRFEPGWDEILIDTLDRCPSPKAIISSYLPNYDPPDKRVYDRNHTLRIRVRRFGEEGDPQVLHITGAFVHNRENRHGLYPCPFYIANFMFARSSVLEELPIDPHIHFYGDETTYAARLWTHGYDIFQLDQIVIFHYWVRKGRDKLIPYKNAKSAKSQRSRERVRHLLEFEKATDPEALVDIERYGLGSERRLEDLWKFAGVDWKKQTISKKSEEGIWNMAARQAGIEKATPSGKLPRVFVQIASYRDKECQYTVKDMFEKAKHPERIFAGICWQYDEEEDKACFEVPYARPDQVRVMQYHYRDAKGASWARAEAAKLLRDEEYCLTIDAHTRFVQDWDQVLIDMLHACDSEKPFLTGYPPPYWPPDKRDLGYILRMKYNKFDFDPKGKLPPILLYSSSAVQETNAPAKPFLTATVSNNFLFASSKAYKEVPFDPNIYFFGDDLTYGVRLWTHGWDLFVNNRQAIYHLWEREQRRAHWDDHKNFGEMDMATRRRAAHIVGIETTTDPLALKDIERFGIGKVRTLEQFQDFAGVNFKERTLKQHAMDGIFPDPNKLTQPVVAPKGQAPAIVTASNINTRRRSSDERIYVNIASYRDRECQWTIKDMFEKATNPDAINVGICWQFDEKEDLDCFQESTRPEQVRMVPVDWREAEGVCWARHMTQQLWDGEPYTLQIDAHMRFVPGWDELLKDELAMCESGKPLLTCSPAAYTPPNKLEKNPRATIRRVQQFFQDGNIRGKGEALDRHPEKPLNGAFVAAGFVFSRSEIIPEVPYDPYLYFDQEEISYATRLYTHGWDVFSSRRPFLYHFYNTDHKNTVRPLHWKDMRDEEAHRKQISWLYERGINRFNHLVGFKQTDNAAYLQDIGKYGFGRTRSLQQFEEYSGVDFKRKVASEKALRCLFIKDLEKYRDKPIYVPEVDDAKKANGTGGKNGVAAAQPQQAAAQPGQPVKVMPLVKAAATMKMMEPGDFIPMIEIPDTADKMTAIEVHGGRIVMLYFLPGHDPDYIGQFFAELKKQLGDKKMDIWMLFVVDDALDKLKALRGKYQIQYSLLCDEHRKFARALGLCQQGETKVPPTGFVLNHNLKIMHRHLRETPEQMVTNMINDCKNQLEIHRLKNRDQRTISEMPPVLIVPGALSQEFCDKLIHSFKTGHSFEGTVGAEDKMGYRPNTKIRRDHILGGQLLDDLDEKLSRSLFPEIRKVFGFEVTHRELYKVGLYTGEKGGFFKQHRDNIDNPLGYRRVAMTIHLTDSFEGGGLRFPEYDEHVYRPALGSAIVFSGGTLHEARPVTKGDRFVLVGFFHGEQDEAYRRYYTMQKGGAYKSNDYLPTLRKYPELEEVRHFYNEWRANNVSFDRNNLLPPAQAMNAKPVNQPVFHAQPRDVVMSQNTKPVMVPTLGNHKAKKVYESKEGMIFDDFLPEDVYQQVNNYALTTDYEYINTKGKIARAWHVHDGFPLRSMLNLFYHADDAKKPNAEYVYPTKTPLDLFVDHMLAIQPSAERYLGRKNENWEHFSVTAWMYPHGTALSMHDDGAGVYAGAYVYFLNQVWRPHWGGLLLMIDEEGNRLIDEHKKTQDAMDFYKRKWLHANACDDLVMEHGFAKCIFPRKNRLVFIANDAYHMVTRVNEQAGDNLRMSLAGFFNKKKP